MFKVLLLEFLMIIICDNASTIEKFNAMSETRILNDNYLSKYSARRLSLNKNLWPRAILG